MARPKTPAASSPATWSERPALDGIAAHLHRRRTSSGFAASVEIEHTLGRAWARSGSGSSCTPRTTSHALGALTGNQAIQQVRAGLKAIYLTGWQVAADANLAGQMYPDQSLYPADSVPHVVRRINQALQRADQIEHVGGQRTASTGSRRSWPTPRPASAGR